MTAYHNILKSYVAGSSFAQRVYSRVLTSRAMWKQRVRRRQYLALHDLCTAHRRIVNPVLERYHLRNIVRAFHDACYAKSALAPHCQNQFYREFFGSDEARRIRTKFAQEPIEDRVRLRFHRDDGDPGRQGNMMILKAPDSKTGEKGVIMLTYNAAFTDFAAVFKLGDILKQYRVVLEPSYSRNFEPSLFLLAGSDTDIVLTSRYGPDHEFIHRAELNFESVWLGASDWVDPDRYVPLSAGDRDIDVVMVASWMHLKRHRLLFKSLAELHPRRLHVALVGYPGDLARQDIDAELSRWKVQDQCTIYENVSADMVAKILARSKVAVHLSKQEGTNKATFEALCCDTPLIVYRHNLGFPMEAITPHTGVLADDSELPNAIAWMVDNHHRFQPRQWILSHTGFANATRYLNDSLRRIATAKGEPWTTDITARVNVVNPRYRQDSDRLALEPAYRELQKLLLC